MLSFGFFFPKYFQLASYSKNNRIKFLILSLRSVSRLVCRQNKGKLSCYHV